MDGTGHYIYTVNAGGKIGPNFKINPFGPLFYLVDGIYALPGTQNLSQHPTNLLLTYVQVLSHVLSSFQQPLNI